MRIASLVFACSLAVAGFSGCATPFAVVSPVTYFERSQVYQPLQSPHGHYDKKNELEAQDAYILTEDGITLHGWYVPHEDPVAVVLFAHGNSGNVTTQAETLRTLRDRHRVSVLAFDYRGYGRSGGVPSEEGLMQDARAARRWLSYNARVDEKDIVLLGQSLGTGVMVDLAAEDGARGLILAEAYSSLPDVGKYHAPLLPVSSMMENRFDSISKIRNYHGPLLQIHGDRDTVIPYRVGKKLFDAANQPKRLITKKGGGHNDPLNEADRRVLDEFLASLPAVQVAEAEDDELLANEG